MKKILILSVATVAIISLLIWMLWNYSRQTGGQNAFNALSTKHDESVRLSNFRQTMFESAKAIVQTMQTGKTSTVTIPLDGNWSIDLGTNSINFETESKLTDVASGIGWIEIPFDGNRTVTLYERSDSAGDVFNIKYSLIIHNVTLKAEGVTTLSGIITLSLNKVDNILTVTLNNVS